MNISLEHPLLAFFEVTGDTNPDPVEKNRHSPALSVSLGSGTKLGCPSCRNPNVPMVSDFAGGGATLSGPDANYFSDFVQAAKYLLVSERVRIDLEENDIQGYKAHSVRTAPGFDFALKQQPISTYYLVEITGRFELDRRRFDNFEGQLCPKCHIWKPTKGSGFEYGELLTGGWRSNFGFFCGVVFEGMLFPPNDH
jgi:hypothetical protein